MPDQELFKAGIEMVQAKLPGPDCVPESSVREIAKAMIREKKLGDAEWLRSQVAGEVIRIKARRSLAKSQGFDPFINMGAKAHRLISEQYAPWILPLMAERLKHPEDITGPRSVQFADAMDVLGESDCRHAESLYHFVTESDPWKDAVPVREAFQKTLKPPKKKNNKGPHTGGRTAPPVKTAQPEGKPVDCRAEIILKLNTLPNAGIKSNQHRFFTITSGEKQYKVTVKPRMFKKLEEAAENFSDWVGIITGQIGHVSANKIMVVDRAAIQVYERQPKTRESIH